MAVNDVLINSDVGSWRQVPGFEGYYEVSDLGDVRSLGRWVASPNGGTRFHEGRVLRPGKLRNGYRNVVFRVAGEAKTLYVHRLVALAFLGLCPHDMQVNHINGERNDNRVCNLEYVTPKQNVRHSVETTRHRDAVGNPLWRQSTLTPETVRRMRALRAHNGMTYKALARRYGVSCATVRDITRGWTWKKAGGPICQVQSQQ